MAIIYCLETDDLIWYVGSTENTPEKRERDHRGRYSKSTGSADIPTDYDWSFRILETCEPPQRFLREKYWYDTLNPLMNKHRPKTARAERLADKRKQSHNAYIANQEQERERSKLKWSQNKELYNARRREKRQQLVLTQEE